MSRKLISSMFLICLTLPQSWAQANDLLAAGPMLGHVDIVEAHLWLQTKQAATVYLRYWPESAPSKTRDTPVQSTTEEHYYIARFALTDLSENTAYAYDLYINDKQVRRLYPTRFKTQPMWQYRTDPPTVRFAMGSCMYVNDPPFDRPGKAYGGDYRVLGLIMAQKPDFMLWLGDNLYLRQSDFYTKSRLAYRYQHSRAFDLMQPLLASCAHYAIWDDHDYGPNDSNRSYPFKNVTKDLFEHYWMNPHFGLTDTPGIFGLLHWADLDFFLLDDRYYRAPERMLDPDRDFLGRGQMRWLKDSLLASRAPFKFIANGSQSINSYNQYESLTHYSGEYNELLTFIRDHHVRGVIFLSGDRHITELLKLERPNAYPLYEFTSSPLSSGLATVQGIEENNPIRVAGTLIQDKRNFGILEVSGPRKKRVLSIKTYDSDGELRWTHEIKSAELK